MRALILGAMALLIIVPFPNVSDGVTDLRDDVEPAPSIPHPEPTEPVVSRAAVAPQQVEVTLSAAQTTTSWDDRDPDRERFELPLLYLHREREATLEPERTLEISLSGVEPGSAIQIEVTSRHVNVSTGDYHSATRQFPLPDRPCTSENPCSVRWTFDAADIHSDLLRSPGQGCGGGPHMGEETSARLCRAGHLGRRVW